MVYQDFIQRVMRLDFVQTAERADAMTKAVVGILASRLSEEKARQLTESLPPELNYSRLVGHQQRPLMISAREYIGDIATEFQLSQSKAEQVVRTVLGLVKEACFGHLTGELPSDWQALVHEAQPAMV